MIVNKMEVAFLYVLRDGCVASNTHHMFLANMWVRLEMENPREFYTHWGRDKTAATSQTML